jgi:hypothetical protein
MNRIIITVIAFFSLNSTASECDFKKGIKRTSKGFLYTNACHRQVGVIVKDNELLELKNTSYQDLLKINETRLELKDKQINNIREQARIWRETALDTQKHAHSLERLSDTSKWLYVASGIVITVAAGFALGAASNATK